STPTRRWLVRPKGNSMGESGVEPERVRVLIVDDEPAICKALKVTLERAGYEVIAAQSGDSALTVLSRERVDVLLLDLRIPDTRGDVVFELAAATHPHLRHQTLFMTGDISERASRLVASCKCPMIKKPFELRDMLNAVEALLPEQRRDARGQSA
ncbi:MAG TPA: response regulator, partial [Gemmatimonadaceae bacterium]|nr:response regulator [Gemmatimonadaceae bacterium]